MTVSFLTKIEYYQILIYFLIILIIGIIILILSFFFSNTVSYTQKLTPYECGFDPFSDARDLFNVQYYIVGILFIIFDLELMFLFPWAISLKYTKIVGFVVMFFFLIVLLFGFIYEWKKGALNWS